jgi:hypothetical protein
LFKARWEAQMLRADKLVSIEMIEAVDWMSARSDSATLNAWHRPVM